MSTTFSSSFDAIGTTVSVVVTNRSALTEATELVRSHVAALDSAASRFREDSELTRLNGAAGRPVEVSWMLFVAIDEALGAARQTDGLVSPSVGEALERCGYDRDFAEVDAEGAPLRRRRHTVPGWQGIQLDRQARTVTVPRGTRVDLGRRPRPAVLTGPPWRPRR